MRGVRAVLTLLTDGLRDGRRRCHSPITWEEGLDDKSFGISISLLMIIRRVQRERERVTWTRSPPPNIFTGIQRKHFLLALTLVDIQTKQADNLERRLTVGSIRDRQSTEAAASRKHVH